MATVEKVEFNTMGMSGVYEKISITPDSLQRKTGKRRTNEPEEQFGKSINQEEWNSVLSALAAISLNNIGSLQSPTNKRTYDGAMHSEIIVTTIDNQSFRHSFDDEDPHAKLEALMEVIRLLSNGTDN
jgi:hypothetical protein